MPELIPLQGEMLRRLQLTELDILKTVADFCDQNNLRYFLTSGTLLGAVRHNGFIPWDDDIDISLPRKDFERFLSLANKLPKDLICQATRFHPQYPIPIVKIRKKGTVMREPAMADLDIEHGVWIDIFPLDSVKDPAKLKTRSKRIHMITTAILWKLGISKPKKWRSIVVCGFLKLFSVKQLDRIRTKMMMADENSDAKYLTSFASNLGSQRLLFEKSVYFPPGELSFEGILFSVPNDPDRWLTGGYGAYMTLPPESERINRHKITELKL